MAGAAVGGLREFIEEHRRILVYGAGGGGDAAGAVYFYSKVKRLGGDPVLAALVWERHPIDPYPGPIPIESLVDAEYLGWTLARVTGATRAMRPHGEVKPQIARVAGALGVEAYAVDATKGAEGVLEALETAAEELGVEAVIGVDVGGDILAKGCEEDLWSPLADALSLYALSETRMPALLVVQGPGADGELPPSTVLRYIARLASQGGLIGVSGVEKADLPLIEKALEASLSEASRIPYRAFKGDYGVAHIRGGTRSVEVTPLQASAYILDPVKAYEDSPLAQAVAGTRGVNRAREELNRLCVYTELDLELDLSRLSESGASADPVKLRSEGRARLRRLGCSPPPCPR